MVTEIILTKPQLDLVTTDKRFPAFVGGFGSGKTEALINRAIVKKFDYPDLDIAYYLPTYDLVSTIGFPRFEEKLDKMGIECKSRSGVKPRIEIEGCGKILFRTMDRPQRIVGYEVADSFIDELDTLKEKDARLVWQKVIARNRQKKPDGKPNTISVGTTPEGFRFVYQQWKNKKSSEEYQLIQAPTESNKHNLPVNYIQDLMDLYPEQLIKAYLNGDFVNLASGSVYPDFSRILNSCNTEINREAKEPLHIGQDFNVTKMASVIFVMRNGDPHAVDEISRVFDTPTLIPIIKQRYPGHPIFIYPDASGQARKSVNASESDIALLKQAQFNVMVNHTNPFIKDRVLSMNIMICGGGKRRLKVNIDKCPSFVTGLEQQIYDDNGDPEKKNDLDHHVDGGGYFICYTYPVINRSMQRIKIGGL